MRVLLLWRSGLSCSHDRPASAAAEGAGIPGRQGSGAGALGTFAFSASHLPGAVAVAQEVAPPLARARTGGRDRND